MRCLLATISFFLHSADVTSYFFSFFNNQFFCRKSLVILQSYIYQPKANTNKKVIKHLFQSYIELRKLQEVLDELIHFIVYPNTENPVGMEFFPKVSFRFLMNLLLQNFGSVYIPIVKLFRLICSTLLLILHLAYLIFMFYLLERYNFVLKMVCVIFMMT